MFISITLFLGVMLAPQMECAVVAEGKIKEMIHQARMDHSTLTDSNPIANLFELNDDSSKELAQPLSLQMAVVRVTDALNREMNSPKWQAMLRALGGDREILKRFGQMRQHFDSLQKQLNRDQDGGGDVEDQLQQLADSNTTSKWSSLWPIVRSSIETVDSLHDWFDRYQKNSAVVNERTLRDFADTVHANGGLTLANTLDAIHKMVCPAPIVNEFHDYEIVPADSEEKNHCRGGIMEDLQQILNQSMSSGSVCSLPKSAHQLVYDFYTLLALTDAKGYAMMQFSWMLLRLYDRGSNSSNNKHAVEAEEARAAYQRRVVEKSNVAQSILSKMSIWKWQCDTPAFEHAENETYIQFKELLQGYIVNEVDMNQDNTCKESCSAYTNSQEKSCFGNQFCGRSRRCPKGRIYNCGFVEADSHVCTSETNSSRRYDWIEYKSGRTFGRKSECNNSGNQRHKVDSWWRWFWHCSYCMCLCDQPGPQSDRYVSLQTVRSASGANRLITGVKFVKIGRVVHIQIQEGQALPRGVVNESTIDWQPIVPVEISHPDSPEDGLGYATLNYEQRAVDLDDLVAPEGHVVTGLRFRKLGGHLNLEMEASPIDYSSGFIDSERAIWMANDNTPASESNPRRKLNLLAPDVPIRSRLPALPDSTSDQFVEFQASSLEKDVSQTTVPFIDGTAVVTQPPSWLTGIGIYHKGQPGYGGYVAFRIATLNVSEHLNVAPRDFDPQDSVASA